jgi:hypothetical protein
MAERIGDYMLRTGAMQQAQVDTVINAQKTGDKRNFGEIAVSMGILTPALIDAFLASQK